MTIFDALGLLGGLAMFLYGMNVMGDALEKRAGSSMKGIVGKMTSNKFKGFLLGLGVTALIQSSSATTVMVVGFVNSGIMEISQAVGVIMGANLGTSVTSWLLSTTGISGETSFWLSLLKPATFTPVLAFIGMLLYIFAKGKKKNDTGLILLGFSVLMFGMEAMADAVEPLAEMEKFQEILLVFSNPFLGIIVGAVFTALIQSSSASVGILQALTSTGRITVGTSIPIIMGQNIGTCVSAMISAIGANKNAKCAAIIHLLFNIIATLILMPLYYLLDWIFDFAFVDMVTSPLGIAVVHTTFKILAVALLMPFTKQLEKMARFMAGGKESEQSQSHLDERFMFNPTLAVSMCREETTAMAQLSIKSIMESISLLKDYKEKEAEKIRKHEDKVDEYEDRIGSYLIKLSAHDMLDKDNIEVSRLLHMIGDYERISDHAVNLVESAEELKDKKIEFTGSAASELKVMTSAVEEILQMAYDAFNEGSIEKALMVEPLEEVVDRLRDELKKRHINRLQKGECSIEAGFVFSDVLTNLERVSDHCSNIASCIVETSHDAMGMHEYLNNVRSGKEEKFNKAFEYYKEKYALDC